MLTMHDATCQNFCDVDSEDLYKLLRNLLASC